MLAELAGTTDLDLVVVNASVRDAQLNAQLLPRLLDVDSRQQWSQPGGDGLFVQVATYLSFIGGVVVRRAFWTGRARTPYFGSLFIHIGVLFQAPAVERAVVIADPLIVIRYGNAMWSSRSFEIWMFKWPELIWSFRHFPESVRARVSPRHPSRSAKRLFSMRAIGSYTNADYARFLRDQPAHVPRLVQAAIARLPAALANLICGLYYALRPGLPSGMALYDLARADHATWFARKLATIRGLR